MKKMEISLIIVIMVLSMSTVIFAFDPGIGNPSPSVEEGIAKIASSFGSAILWIGYAVAIGMLIYIGIKYTMSAANEKAELKKASVNYFIGAVIIASAVTIFGWCVEFFGGAGGGGGTPTGTGGGAAIGDAVVPGTI